MRDLIRWLAVVCLLGAASPLHAQGAPAGSAAPAAAEPAPVAAEPAPVAAEPAPVAAEPAPVAAEPAPVAAEPAPVAAEPAPAAAAPAPVAAAPAETAPAEEPPEEECALGQTCVGPVLTGGIFNAIGVGVHARHGEMWGFGVDFQFLPISAGNVDLMLWLLTLDGRIYPFGGSFFGSLGFSYQSATLTMPVVEGTIGIPQLKFGLGFMGHDGFVMGIDLALGIPLGSSDAEFTTTSSTATMAEVTAAQDDINEKADIFINALPLTFQLNLLRIGYLF